MKSIILASKSEVRKKILDENNIKCTVEPSNLDEDEVKKSLINQGATPELISKNLAELKANKVSQKKIGEIVLGADSVIDLNGKLISKPTNRTEATNILSSLNGKSHFLISSVCISLDGKMIWNYTEKAEMKMKNFTQEELQEYLSKISDKNLYSYNVYQIEGEGKKLFSEIKGDVDTIMGLPIRNIRKYLENIK
jgi:septum formation protein